ncbi:caspase b [Myxocyprinus asiaticus]|uniref:caspase b n=1 Tax=Myxocyprinus asiaticus TaxID=70543 RepID=UPI002223181E|nr:caspase b [Myxocyprinus asiaticus]
MATTKEVILEALEDLLENEFKAFKWQLTNNVEQESISRGKLEHADERDVVDYLVQHYCASDAGKVAVRALCKIKQNELAEQLKKKLKEVSVVPVESGASSSAALSAQTPVVTMNITTTEGGTVKAPVLHNGVYNGPVTFN